MSSLLRYMAKTSESMPAKSQIENIAKTNDEATESKMVLVKKKYVDDPYIEALYNSIMQKQTFLEKRESIMRMKNKSPLICRGYFTRLQVIRQILSSFSFQYEKIQVVGFGAGYDTNYWFLKNLMSTRTDREGKIIKYLEIDFQSVIERKIEFINDSNLLKDFLTNPKILRKIPWTEAEAPNTTTESENQPKTKVIGLESDDYVLISADLEQTSLVKDIVNHYLDKEIPTIFLSECVLVYLEPKFSSPLIQHCATEFKDSFFLLYEQILPHTPFGQQMVKNLKKRNYTLKSIEEYPTKEKQIERFLNLGYQQCLCFDLKEVYEKKLNKNEKFKVEKLEMLDELEEWNLLMGHYCLVLASSKKPDECDLDAYFDGK